jgi:hypothetical protein
MNERRKLLRRLAARLRAEVSQPRHDLGRFQNRDELMWRTR